MADEPTTTTPADTGTDTSATDTLGDAGKKALEAERRDKRAAEKRASDLEVRLKELEDRDKTETQKLTDQLAAAQKQAVDMEARAMRLEVAAEKGLTPVQAKRLVGATREELEADADEIRTEFKVNEDKGDVVDRLSQDLNLGQRGSATTQAGDPARDFEKFMDRQISRR